MPSLSFIIFLLFLQFFGLSKSIHHHLNEEELKQVFGVSNKHDVPEYSLIQTSRVKKSENGNLEMKFIAWNDTFHLDLQKNSRIVSPHIISVIRQGDDITTFNGLRDYEQCHYQGTVTSHNNMKAAISDCGALMGSIVMEDHFLVLQTLPKRVQHLQKEQHLVYKRAAGLLTDSERRIREEITKLQESQESFCDTSESLDDPSMTHLHFNYTVPSSAQLDSPFIFPNMDPITLEIGLFLDSKLYEHFQREYIQNAEQHLLEFSLALINNVHVLYQQDTLTPNLEIVIVRYEMWKTQPSALSTTVHKNGQAQSLLDAFCRYQAHMNPGTDLTDMNHWDHGVLLTGYDIYHTTTSVAGVAPVARMCDPLFACSLVEGLHLGRSFVLAHEMGHNMGMVHDGVQNQCSRSCCLMSAVNGAGKTTWSECSVREFNAFLLQLDESGRGNCLRDASPGLVGTNHLSDNRLPGQRFTADQQCAYFWGRDYRVEIPNGRVMDDICRILWCGNSGSTISTAHPALEGSWCGDNKWCRKGQCSFWPFGQAPPRPVDGAWSEWGGSDKGCPIQQCQVSGSIVVQSQHRDCVDPAPNNGGKSCEGSNIRGIVCGSTSSNCLGFSREEFGNKICSSIKYDPHKPDHQLTGEGFEHSTQPCRVWCHLIDSELIRNKGQFPDGTPCAPDSYCVGGQCLPLSCDDKALVEQSEDCPRLEGRSVAEWLEWSTWSECSQTCGKNGVQTRNRQCSSGQNCRGVSEESKQCDQILPECQEFGEWQDWSECSEKCAVGTQTRYRSCLSDFCSKNQLKEEKPCDNEGCWTEWDEWSSCSQTCGGGKKYRIRKCLDDKCIGDDLEKQTCNEEKCVQQTWGDWLPCSVSCGIGFQIRERLCDGQLCQVANKQARTCNQQQCPSLLSIAVWNEWGEWSTCTASCGEGIQVRERGCRRGSCSENESSQTRRCVNGPCDSSYFEWSEWSNCISCSSFDTRQRFAKCDGTNTDCQDKMEEESCDTVCLREHTKSSRRPKLITSNDLRKAFGKPNLPIDSASNWSEWSSCSVTCGTGHQKRTRECKDGTCSQTQECSSISCLELFVWSDWSECSKSCGNDGVQTRQKLCLFNTAECSNFAESRKCYNLPACNKNLITGYDFDAPSWSDWSPWSACSCFSLTSTRRRFCQVADPTVQGFCAGPILEQIPCVPASCTPSAGSWSSWSKWSSCSRDCGETGHQIRNRMCGEPIPSNRGAYCPGYSFDQRPCKIDNECGIKVDGSWTEWTDWSECSDHCRNGHRSRTRFCANPKPSQGGAACSGSDFELQPCYDPAKCHSRDGGWSSWTDWTDCSASCGFGYQSRDRTCSSPTPMGGKSCDGLAHQMSLCDLPACNYESDGEWSAWNEWSNCVGNCGVGTRTRIRACVSPPSLNGGQPCFGRSSEIEECSSSANICSSFLTSSTQTDGFFIDIDQ